MKMMMTMIRKSAEQIERESWEVYQTALAQLDFSEKGRFDKAQRLYGRYLLDLEDAGIVATMTGYEFKGE